MRALWFKVDDGFYRGPKVRKLGKRRVSAQSRVASVGIWTLAGDWSADNLTDGFVPWEVIEDWDPDRALAGRLVKAGLWFEVDRGGESGCQFHDWPDWQPTSDQVKQRRKADAERKARWRVSRWSHGGTSDHHDSESQGVSRRDSRQESRQESGREARQESRRESSLPDPTRPVSTSFGPVLNGGVQLGNARAQDQEPPPPKDQLDAQKRPRCAAHRHLPDDEPGPPCTGCRDARLAGDDHSQLARRLRRQAITECPACDEFGWELDDVGAPAVPARKCNHL